MILNCAIVRLCALTIYFVISNVASGQAPLQTESLAAALPEFSTLVEFEERVISAIKKDPSHTLDLWVRRTSNPQLLSNTLCHVDTFPDYCSQEKLNRYKKYSMSELGKHGSELLRLTLIERSKTILRLANNAATAAGPKFQFQLAQLYEFGTNSITPNQELAANWYRHAAETGHERAAQTLGMLYWTGQGIKQDFQQAIDWYKKGRLLEVYKMAKLQTPAELTAEKIVPFEYWSGTINFLLRRNGVDYPSKALRDGITGDVDIIVYAEGKVILSKSSGHEILDSAALRAVKNKIAIAPPPEEIKAIKAGIIIPLAFKISE